MLVRLVPRLRRGAVTPRFRPRALLPWWQSMVSPASWRSLPPAQGGWGSARRLSAAQPVQRRRRRLAERWVGAALCLAVALGRAAICRHPQPRLAPHAGLLPRISQSSHCSIRTGARSVRRSSHCKLNRQWQPGPRLRSCSLYSKRSSSSSPRRHRGFPQRHSSRLLLLPRLLWRSTSLPPPLGLASPSRYPPPPLPAPLSLRRCWREGTRHLPRRTRLPRRRSRWPPRRRRRLSSLPPTRCCCSRSHRCGRTTSAR